MPSKRILKIVCSQLIEVAQTLKQTIGKSIQLKFAKSHLLLYTILALKRLHFY